MFAKKITESDAFLDMPMSSQCLYFHLNMAADDDGFVNNPKRIMRSIGASEDDFKLLIAKSFIIIFDTGVIVIKHWKMHNYIQTDRYKPTDYLEEKSMLGIKKDKAYTLDETKMDTKCIQNVSIGKDRLGKDRLGKDRLGDMSSDEDLSAKADAVPYQKVVDEYNRICVSLPRVTALSDRRKQSIKARLKKYSLQTIVEAFEKVEASSFLKGSNNRDWQACFDWIMNDTNIAKILDGNYDDRGGGSSAGRRKDDGGVQTSYATPDINELYRQKHKND